MTLKNISLLFLGAVVVSLLVVTPYYLGISGGDGLPSLSGKNQDWGAFGSYFGGVLGPILSMFSILFVWSQSHKSNAALKKQLLILQFESFENQFFRSIQHIKEIQSQTSKDLRLCPYIGLECYNQETATYLEASKSLGAYIVQDEESKQEELWVSFSPYLAEISALLIKVENITDQEFFKANHASKEYYFDFIRRTLEINNSLFLFEPFCSPNPYLPWENFLLLVRKKSV